MSSDRLSPDTSLKEVADSLSRARRIVFTTHVTPDGDGIGSAMALMRAMRRRGKDAQFINCSSSPMELRFLCRRGEYQVFDARRHQDILSRADVILATDLGGVERLSGMRDAVANAPAEKILLDHHAIEPGFFDIAAIDRSASSTAELAWQLLTREFGLKLDLQLAEPLYVGLISDTGQFAYGQTTARAHLMAADLLRAGLDPYAIWRQLNCQVSPEKLRFLGVLLASLNVASAGRVIWTEVTTAMLEQYAVPARDAFEVLSSMLRQKGSEVALFVMEIDRERTKVSLRSAGRIDVAEIAKRYGGGGHPAAAGCIVMGHDLPAAREALLSDLEQALSILDDGDSLAVPLEDQDVDSGRLDHP